MKGGHARSGPPPDPNALRRERDGSDWVDLPAAGREGPIPPWPLAGKQAARERELWAQLWAKPQAIMWEARGQELEVALYVRRFREAEKPNSPVTLSTWVRQAMEVLGLSSMGLRANKWRIVADPAQRRAQSRRSTASARDRFTIVDGEAG